MNWVDLPVSHGEDVLFPIFCSFLGAPNDEQPEGHDPQGCKLYKPNMFVKGWQFMLTTFVYRIQKIRKLENLYKGTLRVKCSK